MNAKRPLVALFIAIAILPSLAAERIPTTRLEIETKAGYAVPLTLFAGVHMNNPGSIGATAQCAYAFTDSFKLGICVGGLYSLADPSTSLSWSIPIDLVCAFNFKNFRPFVGFGTDVLPGAFLDTEHFWNVYLKYGLDYALPLNRSLSLLIGVSCKNIIALNSMIDAEFDGAPVHAETMTVMPNIGIAWRP